MLIEPYRFILTYGILPDTRLPVIPRDTSDWVEGFVSEGLNDRMAAGEYETNRPKGIKPEGSPHGNPAEVPGHAEPVNAPPQRGEIPLIPPKPVPHRDEVPGHTNRPSRVFGTPAGEWPQNLERR